MTNSKFKFLGKFKPIAIQCLISVRIPLTSQRFWYAIIILIYYKIKYNTKFPEWESYKKLEKSHYIKIVFYSMTFHCSTNLLHSCDFHQIFLRLFYPFEICMAFFCYLINDSTMVCVIILEMVIQMVSMIGHCFIVYKDVKYPLP